MSSRVSLFGFAVLGGLAIVLVGCSPPPLTRERTFEAMPENPRKELAFTVGPFHPSLRCEQRPPPTLEDDPVPAAAIALGWLSWTCENGFIARKLTDEGQRRSSGWWRSGHAGMVAEPDEEVGWFIHAGHFERSGVVEIERRPTDIARHRENFALVHFTGHWVTTPEGELLRRAGVKKLDETRYDVLFEWRSGRWDRATEE